MNSFLLTKSAYAFYSVGMSFQAYLDSIKDKTGLEPADFKKLAAERGLLADNVTTSQLVAWLAEDFDLGRGHAMAIVATLRPTRAKDKSDDPVGAFFGGAKAKWRPVFDNLLTEAAKNGPVATSVTSGYISLLKGTGKFAIVAATGNRLDIGLKLPGVAPTERFASSGTWNSMVTHRVSISAHEEIDTQVLNWLRDAYERA